jgi:hypothetical protein
MARHYELDLALQAYEHSRDLLVAIKCELFPPMCVVRCHGHSNQFGIVRGYFGVDADVVCVEGESGEFYEWHLRNVTRVESYCPWPTWTRRRLRQMKRHLSTIRAAKSQRIRERFDST